MIYGEAKNVDILLKIRILYNAKIYGTDLSKNTAVHQSKR
jgi:hypothetical protein